MSIGQSRLRQLWFSSSKNATFWSRGSGGTIRCPLNLRHAAQHLRLVVYRLANRLPLLPSSRSLPREVIKDVCSNKNGLCLWADWNGYLSSRIPGAKTVRWSSIGFRSTCWISTARSISFCHSKEHGADGCRVWVVPLLREVHSLHEDWKQFRILAF